MKMKTEITGIILAGGKSSRMGSDKGFLELNGISFTQHIIETLKTLVDNIIIVSDAKDYDAFGYKRVEDRIKNAGPLAGVYSGLSHSKTDKNIIVSCDVPLINESLLKLLILNDDESTDIVQFENKQRTIPLIALYKKSCASKCLDFLKKGERRLTVVVNQLHTKTIELPEMYQQNIKNINTPEELKNITDAVNY